VGNARQKQATCSNLAIDRETAKMPFARICGEKVEVKVSDPTETSGCVGFRISQHWNRKRVRRVVETSGNG
jgi:hypothetical protein